ncbi:MAG: hypothetical protein IT303_07660 [Dehalococcoidia bacterium]|nr:hypothetical protein [Dehalococcoidia bacterium]
MRILAVILLPLAAAMAVAAMVLTLSPRDDTGAPGRAATQETSKPSPTPTREASARLPAEGNVCQGVLHRPAPGAPQTFPALYTQRTDAAGLAIVAPAGVSPEALEIARQTVEHVFAENDLEDILAEEGAYVVVAEPGQRILDLPEFDCLDGTSQTDVFDHACGVADRADYPIVTVNELDLLGDRSGPCAGLNVLYHELGHLVQNWSISPADYIETRILYQAALSAGRYRDAYAATNHHEYFAEATQAYFIHADLRGIQDRDWLERYDPALFELVDRVYSGE